MTSTERPITIPAIIDSQGNPGIGGATRGSVRLDEGVSVTVMVPPEVVALLEVLDVLIDVELELWTVEVLSVLDALLDVVELAVDVLLTTLVEIVVTTDVDVDAAVVGGGPPEGGSKWNIIPSDASPPAPAVVPTANPLVLESKNMLCSLPWVWEGNGGIVATVLQADPSQWTNTGRWSVGESIFSPTAQPSVVEVTWIAVKLYDPTVKTGFHWLPS
jgi:hypothetical protein